MSKKKQIGITLSEKSNTEIDLYKDVYKQLKNKFVSKQTICEELIDNSIPDLIKHRKELETKINELKKL